MRIYTRTGDAGQTRLSDMSLAAKTDLRVEAYGQVDEANSILGVATARGDLPERLSDAQISQILAASTHVFASFVMPTGELPMTIRAHLVMGRKPWA